MINPEEYISLEEVSQLLHEALPATAILLEISPVVKGSTNTIFKIKTEGKDYILKISHRADRNKGGILEKEAYILKEHGNNDYYISIPRLIWQGKTKKNWPAILISALEGERVGDILKQGIDSKNAGKYLGKFVAEWHKNKHNEVDEFETDRKPFRNFETYARYWLKEWEPLCFKATHISQEDVRQAYDFILKNLSLFKEQSWSYVHGDISRQNLLGKIVHNELVLTGLCDFENVQTGPVEYDIATMDDALFLFYPEMRKSFFEGYEEISSLPENFNLRLKTTNLFRALRYIKRSVKYNEVHYFDHDRKYFESWLKK